MAISNLLTWSLKPDIFVLIVRLQPASVSILLTFIQQWSVTLIFTSDIDIALFLLWKIIFFENDNHDIVYFIDHPRSGVVCNVGSIVRGLSGEFCLRALPPFTTALHSTAHRQRQPTSATTGLASTWSPDRRSHSWHVAFYSLLWYSLKESDVYCCYACVTGPALD